MLRNIPKIWWFLSKIEGWVESYYWIEQMRNNGDIEVHKRALKSIRNDR